MGCSYSEVLDNDSKKIIDISLKLYINDLEIKTKLNKPINQKYEYEKYYLINKFWMEDYKDFFKYEEIIKELNNLERNDKYLSYKNNFKNLLEEICDKDNIIRSMRQFKNRNKLSEEIKIFTRAKNNFIFINKGRVFFPEINTILIKESIFTEMIDIINHIEDSIKKIDLDYLIHSNVLIGDNNIYINMDNNKNIIKNNENFNNNLLICFFEESNLKTKYYIKFEKEKDFDEIINNYLIGNKLENNIKNISKGDNDNDSEPELIIGSQKKGYYFSLIPNYENNGNIILYNNNLNKIMNYSSNVNDNDSFQPNFLLPKKERLILINNKRGENNNNSKNNNEIINNQIIIKNSQNNCNVNISINNNNNNNNLMGSNNNININFQNNISINNNTNNNNINNNINNNNINNNNIDNNNSYNLINISNSNNNINSNIININNEYEEFIIKRIKRIKNKNYINEFLQCLANVDIIKDFFINHETQIEECKNYTPMCTRFINTLKYVYNIDNNNNDKFFDDEFLKKDEYKKIDNNITSFITILLGGFKEELQSLYLLINTLHNIFYGQRTISYKCSSCQTNKNIIEQFCYLKFNLSNIFKYLKTQKDNIKSITVKDCFDYYKKHFDGFTCENCGNNTFIKYNNIIDSLQEVLILIIENGDTNLLNKYYFNNDIILKNNNKKGYELISKINLKKNKEYVTYLKSNENSNWYTCEDNNIKYLCKETDIINIDQKNKKEVPFVLIYKKVDDLPKDKFIDELDRTIEIIQDKTIDLIFYSTVSKIKDKLDHLDYDMTIESLYNKLCEKYNFKRSKILFFNNSRKLDCKKTIRENNLENEALIIIVEYNFY